MDNELFGERHEEEEFGLHGRLHEEQANEVNPSNESGEICESELIVEHRNPEWDASMEDLKWKIHFGSKL